MGERAEAEMPDNRPGIMSPQLAALWRNWQNPSEEDAFFCSVSRSKAIADVASHLLDERDVRWWSDTLMCKMPATEGGFAHPLASGLPLPRDGPPGRLQLLDRTRRHPAGDGGDAVPERLPQLGPMGRVIHRTDGIDLLDLHPWIAERVSRSPSRCTCTRATPRSTTC